MLYETANRFILKACFFLLSENCTLANLRSKLLKVIMFFWEWKNACEKIFKYLFGSKNSFQILFFKQKYKWICCSYNSENKKSLAELYDCFFKYVSFTKNNIQFNVSCNVEQSRRFSTNLLQGLVSGLSKIQLINIFYKLVFTSFCT